MNERRRPDNGPGANGLRGGSRNYSQKVQTGNWVENYGGPEDYKRGFSTADFETEGQHAQKGALLSGPAEYGAGLPLPQLLMRKAPTAADSFVTRGEYIETRSNMQITNDSFVQSKANFQEYKPKPTISREALEKYRAKWTIDTDHGRRVRYVTENRLAGNSANSKFVTTSIRSLPGTPKCLETFRENLLETYGVLAMSVLRSCIGNGNMAVSEFKRGMVGTEVKAQSFELDQMVAFVTPSNAEIDAAQFLRTIKGRPDGAFDASVSKSIFAAAEASDEDHSICSIFSLLDAMAAPFSPFPELEVGFRTYMAAYGANDELTAEQFTEFHSDLFISSPSSYKTIFG